MSKDDTDLEHAYGLKTPEDSVALYRGWAKTYDASFATSMDYQSPKTIAEVFAGLAKPADGPVLDVGAGTGLVGAVLSELGDWQVDGLDISPEMLQVALAKGCYREGLQADLTRKLAISDATYGGIVSAGTFTHGHVGPDALDELLRISRPGALFVLGVHSEFFTALGFDRKMADLDAEISGFQLLEKAIYGENSKAARQDDTIQVMVFRKS